MNVKQRAIKMLLRHKNYDKNPPKAWLVMISDDECISIERIMNKCLIISNREIETYEEFCKINDGDIIELLAGFIDD